MISGTFFSQTQTKYYWQLESSIVDPVESLGVVSVAYPHVDRNVNTYVPEGAPEPVYVVEILPDTGKQHVAVDQVTELNVFVAVYFAKL